MNINKVLQYSPEAVHILSAASQYLPSLSVTPNLWNRNKTRTFFQYLYFSLH